MRAIVRKNSVFRYRNNSTPVKLVEYKPPRLIGGMRVKFELVKQTNAGEIVFCVPATKRGLEKSR